MAADTLIVDDAPSIGELVRLDASGAIVRALRSSYGSRLYVGDPTGAERW